MVGVPNTRNARDAAPHSHPALAAPSATAILFDVIDVGGIRRSLVIEPEQFDPTISTEHRSDTTKPCVWQQAPVAVPARTMRVLQVQGIRRTSRRICIDSEELNVAV